MPGQAQMLVLKLRGPLPNISVPMEPNLGTTFSKYPYLTYPYVRGSKRLDYST